MDVKLQRAPYRTCSGFSLTCLIFGVASLTFFQRFSKGCEARSHSSNFGDFWGTEHFFKLSTSITVVGYATCQKDNTSKLEIFRWPFFQNLVVWAVPSYTIGRYTFIGGQTTFSIPSCMAALPWFPQACLIYFYVKLLYSNHPC